MFLRELTICARVWLSAQTPLRGYMRYARSGRAYAQSRNVLARDVRVPGFCPDTYDIPLCVIVSYEKRAFLS